jgi:hypothetical protein
VLSSRYTYVTVTSVDALAPVESVTVNMNWKVRPRSIPLSWRTALLAPTVPTGEYPGVGVQENVSGPGAVDVDAEASRVAKLELTKNVLFGDVLPLPVTEMVIELGPGLPPPGGGKTVKDPVAAGE